MTSAPTGDLSDGDYERLATFRHALRVFIRFSEEAARAEGVTPAQHQLMLAVRGWPGPTDPTLSDVADFLQLRLNSAGELARRAEAAGLVRLVNDRDDHRKQHVVLTKAGAEKLRDLTVLHRDELKRFRSHLSDLLDVLA
ncbi:MAG: winged helix-turn-helix transcriptional regulator [Acidimicrobiales bacterium]|nr:winged helix-turn-helix transcriptional regulator [Acidimicrobiales bacterium]